MEAVWFALFFAAGWFAKSIFIRRKRGSRKGLLECQCNHPNTRAWKVAAGTDWRCRRCGSLWRIAKFDQWYRVDETAEIERKLGLGKE